MDLDKARKVKEIVSEIDRINSEIRKLEGVSFNADIIFKSKTDESDILIVDMGYNCQNIVDYVVSFRKDYLKMLINNLNDL